MKGDKKLNLYQRLLNRIYQYNCLVKREKLSREIESKFSGYRAFLEDLSSGDATGVSAYPWRVLDIEKVLNEFSPKHIVELGGGSSTGQFARYVQAYEGSSLLSIDESAEWGGLTQAAMERAGMFPHPGIDLITASRLENEYGSYYQAELPENIDLLYIDGPSVMKKDGVKTANQDILMYFDRGQTPAVIMVDGRNATVDAIRGHLNSSMYTFIPSMQYLIITRSWPYISRNLGKFHRHSVFIKKQ